jgi:hypothetical protein
MRRRKRRRKKRRRRRRRRSRRRKAFEVLGKPSPLSLLLGSCCN